MISSICFDFSFQHGQIVAKQFDRHRRAHPGQHFGGAHVDGLGVGDVQLPVLEAFELLAQLPLELGQAHAPLAARLGQQEIVGLV